MLLVAACDIRGSQSPDDSASRADGTSESVGSQVATGSFTLRGDPSALKGGSLTLGTSYLPERLSYYGPGRVADIAMVYVPAMMEPLITIHASTLEYVPILAESWDVSEDQRTVTFSIDPDALWSDGTPVTAADVTATLDLIRAPDVGDELSREELELRFPDPPEVLDERTLRFVSPTSSWRNLLFFADLPIYPDHLLDPASYHEDWRWSPPAATGQYRVQQPRRDDELTLIRRTDHWGEGKRQFVGIGNFDRITFRKYSDSNSEFEALKRGEVDVDTIASEIRWKEDCDFEATRMGWVQKSRVYHLVPQGPASVALNLTDPLFSDVRVRKALFWLYNREARFPSKYNQNSYFSNSFYENLDNEKVTYDPAKGAALLDEADWAERDSDGIRRKGDLRLEFEYPYIHPSFTEHVETVRASFEKHGIRMKPVLISTEEWIRRLRARDFQAIYINWSESLFPELRNTWHSDSAGEIGSWNITGFQNAEVDKLIEEYELEPDLGRRVAIVRKIDAILSDSCPYLLDWISNHSRLLWWNRFGMPEWTTYAMRDPRNSIWQVWWVNPDLDGQLRRATAGGTKLPLAAHDNMYWLQPARWPRFRSNSFGRPGG